MQEELVNSTQQLNAISKLAIRAGMSLELDREKHVKFLKRHLLILPSAQQGNDVNKMAIIFYSITALGALDAGIPTAYSPNLPWICKHYVKVKLPCHSEVFSGFVGSLSTATPTVPCISLPNTLFAMLTLKVMKCEEFFTSLLDKDSLGLFLNKLQCPDGSFASVLDMNQPEPSPVDSTDLRFCYIATAILRLIGCRSKEDFGQFIDVDRVIDYMLTKKCDIGGFGDYGEPHAGYTSCALSAFSILGCLDRLDDHFRERTVDWLLSRQVSKMGCMSLEEGHNPYHDDDEHGGFQGRENKFADTCYVFWCLNSLSILDKTSFNSACRDGAAQEYLLTKTQNTLVGGFSKNDQDNPDLYHTCLGIAALGMMQGNFDGVLCIPKGFS
ncbi:CDC43 (YGL155W) [Zygosaccharomyces parabailii]|nr:CDC43 (YGL155W) [Zygosaccharomyces parabailii]CDH13623.1 related to Geranylgeranyl transferase type-1 subunit beta [Zygosaccharomyces bailii ISA1307]